MRKASEIRGFGAGVIGEIGCQEPLEPAEAKVLAAAAMAQRQTGVALTVHTALHDVPNKRIAKQARQEIEILRKHDCDLSKVYISHMDFTHDDLKYQRGIMDEYGITMGYDTFGQEQHYNNIYMGAIGIPDSARSAALLDHLKNGYAKQIMLSTDVCQKIHLKKYGGWGYSNVLEYIVPYIREMGATAKDVRTMMVENPKRILSR